MDRIYPVVMAEFGGQADASPNHRHNHHGLFALHRHRPCLALQEVEDARRLGDSGLVCGCKLRGAATNRNSVFSRCLQLPSLIAPATLVVVPAMNMTELASSSIRRYDRQLEQRLRI